MGKKVRGRRTAFVFFAGLALSFWGFVSCSGAKNGKEIRGVFS